VTTTTHKSLRGPRGGLVLATGEYADSVDRGCPLVLGGPLGHVMAAKAVALAEARSQEFRAYAQAVADNAKTLADGLLRRGAELVTGGTDYHGSAAPNPTLGSVDIPESSGVPYSPTPASRNGTADRPPTRPTCALSAAR